MLKLENLSSGYNGHDVLHSISLEISRPAIYAVLGPNGAGKTTLFRTVAGVLRASSGSVSLDARDLYFANAVRREIGYLSHLTALPEEMTIKAALEFYGRVEGGSSARVIESLGLSDLANKKVADLSQGQRKRAAIAGSALTTSLAASWLALVTGVSVVALVTALISAYSSMQRKPTGMNSPLGITIGVLLIFPEFFLIAVVRGGILYLDTSVALGILAASLVLLLYLDRLVKREKLLP